MDETEGDSAQVQGRPVLHLSYLLPFPEPESLGQGGLPGLLVRGSFDSYPLRHGIERTEAGGILPVSPEINSVKERVIADMVGVVVGVEEGVDFFTLCQGPEGPLFAGGVHQKCLPAF